MIRGINSTLITSCSKDVVEKQLAACQKAGITWLRCRCMWDEVEAVKGTFTWDALDFLTQRAPAYGVSLLCILAGAPLWANGGKKFYPPADLSSWNNFTSKAVYRYPSITTWEIWNEQNIAFWLPAADPDAYMALVKATANVRPTGPKLIMGGLAGPDATFMEALLKRRLADYVDAITYHPYANTLPCPWWVLFNKDPQEAIALDCLAKMRELVKKYTSKPLEIWLTELGWSTAGFPWWDTVSEQQQADFWKRTRDSYAAAGVDALFYYDLWEMANDKASPWTADWFSNITAVNHMGIIRHDFTEKPLAKVF